MALGDLTEEVACEWSGGLEVSKNRETTKHSMFQAKELAWLRRRMRNRNNDAVIATCVACLILHDNPMRR